MKKIMIATLALTLFAGVANAQTTPATSKKPATPTKVKPMMKKETAKATTTATTAAKPVAKDATTHTAMMRKHTMHKKTKAVPKATTE